MLVIHLFQKLINLFYKEYCDKIIVILLLIDTTLLMVLLIIKANGIITKS